ncbi:Pleckstrin homology domain Mcp5-type [Penicillium paradoxum]|uniref:Pleckstrin homology domain Mcp5-type n=1 Tax=Penicillium paradoxum TaxID=176176 RepID=UPI002547BCF8|nr:Pleckstrin homology domain Mcp5-type [Penicillium paradoxum]KAJ5794871.1 Pleckstrin homology domain Mcp5-type [Penicillium paradoxum]
MTTSNVDATGPFGSMEDPFVAKSGKFAVPRDSHRYSSFDTQLYSLNASSPAQAKRALEAHLAETERRLEEASKLGTALIEQQQQLSEQLKEVEQQQDEGEMGPELRRKLADLEKEYNEIGRESARAFLGPKRLAGGPEDAQPGTPTFDTKSPLNAALFASQATNSPSKVSVPSRKQRNQPSNRVHDIEFATEISTSLLAQVRQLQALLAERDETLKFVNLEKSRLELEAEGYGQRIRALDDGEQRYKDENWALETQAHELMAALRDAAEREQRLNSTVTTSNAEKNAVERELEELRQANARLLEEQSLTQKANDAEIHLLRRNLTSGDAEKSALQKKLLEMTSQNQELAKIVTMRLREHESQGSRDVSYDNEDNEPDHITPESSPPPSPNKFTPRHGHLESETLKSSLGHAHRMIQNLKSTIHREKTEKIELKRMLQDARDEVETRRRESTVPNASSKRQKTKPDTSRKPPVQIFWAQAAKKNHLLSFKIPTGKTTLAKSMPIRGPSGSESPDGPSDVYQTATEAEDGFETANERATATESEAFQTGLESMADDSSDSADLTETENNVQTTPRRRVPSSLVMAKARDRTSYHSTASASSEEEDYDRAFGSPSQMHMSRPRVRSKRSFSRRIRPSGEAPFASTSRPSSSRESPTPSFAAAAAAQEGQSLFAELADLDSTEEDDATSQASTPRMEPALGSRRPSDAMLDATPKPAMVDSGVMTEPWEPTLPTSAALVAGAAGVAAGAAVTHALAPPQTTQSTRDIIEIADGTPQIVISEVQSTPANPLSVESDPLANVLNPSGIPLDERSVQDEQANAHAQTDLPELAMAGIASQETEPRAPSRPDLTVSYINGGTTTPVKHVLPTPEVPEMTISSISSQITSPIHPTVAVPEPIIKHVDVIKYVEREPEVPELTFSSIAAQSTSPVQATLAVPEPVIKYVDVIKHVEREREIPELSFSSVAAQSTTPVQAIQATVPEPEPVIKYVDVIKHVEVEREREVPELTFSTINSQSTAPVHAVLAVPEPVIQYVDVIKHVEVERELEVPELSISPINNHFTAPVRATVAVPEPVVKYVDVIKHIEREPEIPELTFSSITTQSTAPVKATVPEPEPPVIQYVDVIKHVEREPEIPELTFSSITTQSTAPVKATVPEPEPPVIQYVDVIKHVEREREVPELSFSSITAQSTTPAYAELAKPEPTIQYVEREREVPELIFSSIATQSTAPVKATVPEPERPVIQYVDVIKHVEREREVPELTISCLDPSYTEPIIPTPRVVPTPALSFSSVSSVETHPVKSMPFVIPAVADLSTQTEPAELKAAGAAVIVHEDKLTNTTRSRPNTANSQHLAGAGLALNDISGNALARSAKQKSSSVSTDQGSQTILSSKQIDQILMDRGFGRPLSSDSQVTDNSREIAAVATTAASGYMTPKAQSRPRLSQIQTARSTTPNQRRPPSATSGTSGASAHPPLPCDHREAIMAAEKRSIDMAPPSPNSAMGPPLAPASAYRMNSQRPLTPSEHAARAASSRTGSSQARVRRGSQSQLSRRSSVSSFASEIEERFNINTHSGPIPQGYGPNTDPRMIQAITQTMIGEFLWKYTRKTGSSEMSSTRHRRYFWVHPYTRTLYWSTQDPQTAGKTELRTKSVPIEAVRVVADDNPYPPGLHCRSLEVVSPGRRVRFTATTSQRHETWFNALSYLLLRESDNYDDNSVSVDGIDDFHPPSLRSSSRPNARTSFSSHNSRTARTIKQRRAASAMSLRSNGTHGGRASPALTSPVPNSSLQVPDEARQRSSSRLSTISSSIRGSIANLKGRHGQSPSIGGESLHGQESADDLRQVIETQEQDRLENVRACCDGKHDVGSLSRTSRYSPRVDRMHSPHHH